ATSGKGAIKSPAANELMAACGLVTLAWAVHRYDSTMPYPGLYASAPCAASVMLIHSGRQRSTIIARFLSLRPVVFTGLISYSLYLWHFPVLTLAGYYHIATIGPFGMGMLIGCTYLLAVASWRWIEMPVRTGVLLERRRSFLLSMVALNTLLLATGVVLWKTGGLPRRFSPEVQARGGDLPFATKYLSECTSI